MPKVDHRVELTDRKLRALKPAAEGQRYQVMDTLVPGFGVRVTATGNKSFILRTRYPGERHPARRELGQVGVLGLAAAREKARQWSALVKQGIDPALAEDRARAEARRAKENTVEAIAADWFAEKLPGERKGAEVERDFRNVFLTRWAKRPVSEITELDVLAVIREKKKTAPAQARNLLGHVRRFFGWAIDQRVYGITASPCEHLKPLKIVGEKPQSDRVLSDDELFALWRAAHRVPYPHGAVYQMLILTGLRLNEAADADWSEFPNSVLQALRSRKDGEAIDWRRFDHEDLAWIIPAARMKGRAGKARPHAVPLTPAVLAVLEALPHFDAGAHIFSTTFGASPVWMSDKVKKRLDRRMLRTLRALARCRGEDPATVILQRWTNHDIRRTVRSRLSRLRISEEAREAVLAHARPGIKGVYDHHDYLDEKREALNLWAQQLMKIVRPGTASNVLLLHAAH